MTEERMICEKKRKTTIKNGISMPHQKYTWKPVEPAPPKGYIEELEKRNREMFAEIAAMKMEASMHDDAPPKDWRPYCYSNYLVENHDQMCNYMVVDLDMVMMAKECKTCPYRKRD